MAKDANNKKPKRRIIKGMMEFISLCPYGANTLQTTYKTDDGKDQTVRFTSLAKNMTEQGELIACVYSPDLVDSQGDVASAEVIKEFAYEFAKKGQGLDIRHNEQVLPKEAAYIAESFIIQKADPRFASMKDYEGNVVDVTGGWGVVIKIDDEDLRAKYRSGEWQGVSMGGFMLVKDAEKTSVFKGVLKEFIEGLKNIGIKKDNSNSEIDMDKSELQTVLKENNTTLATAIVEGITKALNPSAADGKNKK